MIDAYFISEVSWEVANKVGGIYTVLSSRAGEMMHRHGAEQVLFVGPRLRPMEEMVDFRAETFCITLPSHISLLGVELPMHCRRVAYDLLITLEERTASTD